MALGHAGIGLVSAILVATSLLFLFFVILSGVSHKTPFGKTYFLRADTHDITGAHATTQWTYFYACGEGNVDCGDAHPAMPFGKAWAAHASGVPDALIGSYGGGTTSKYYYYMWRFGWVFYLMALFFEACAFFSSFLACCGRLGSGIGGAVSVLALFFLTLAVSLMTATFVKARNVFRDAGRPASLGRYAFGFSWGAWAALFIALVLLCVGTASGPGRGRKHAARGSVGGGAGVGAAADGSAAGTAGTDDGYLDGPAPVEQPNGHTMSKKGGFRGFRRGRSKRSNAGSFSKVHYDNGSSV